MFKKCLMGLVLLTIISMPAMAEIFLGDVEVADKPGSIVSLLKAEDWPVTFDWKATKLVIPVTMDVGLFIQINNKKAVVDKGIKLKQTAIQTFEGCSLPIEIQSNFNFNMRGVLTRTAAGDAIQSNKDKWTVKIKASDGDPAVDCATQADDALVVKTLSACKKYKSVYVKVVEAKIFEMDYGCNIKVADVTIEVQPKLEFEWTLCPCP